ncbi:hypothetical protein GCM10010885_02700 [Alicyclobacillus cellulosilyticus]|uniref:Uncharacterized protein n=1 Tax=Alicyclobacillus cellulosilyticus TaxID=1003997 RepID=A0A917K2M2_9BACL|nr:hypothetical protein [Alicyclobacillus cellulosilyticus]GGI96443.1 hypothetical protein GCM10010885_02700 [Alicyclobacillus cellulosilyticus]
MAQVGFRIWWQHAQAKQEQRWAAVESWLEEYGALVLDVVRDGPWPEEVAWRALEEVFAAAYRAYPAIVRRHDPRGWLLAEAKRWQARLRERQEGPQDGPGERAEGFDHPEDTAPSVPDATGKPEDVPHTLPLVLHVRTLQRLRATTAQLEAERRHHGPRWTAHAVGWTIVVGLLAVGYGLYGEGWRHFSLWHGPSMPQQRVQPASSSSSSSPAS